MTEEELERYTEIAERYSRTWPQGKAAIDLLVAEVRRLQAENAKLEVGGFISREDALDIAKAMMEPPVVNLN